ncbi:MAG: VRR-NUC domain-containing protein [Roseburia sp.]|nr:VRR-NUC domain-containing protein [Roseburia sp.]
MQNVRIDTESGAQDMLFTWAMWQQGARPELELLHHIPNGGKRDARTGRALKRQGVKAGVPDLCLPVARGGFHGLYIELKVGNNTTSPRQKEWISNLGQQGYCARVCRGWEEAKETIEGYLDGKIQRKEEEE